MGETLPVKYKERLISYFMSREAGPGANLIICGLAVGAVSLATGLGFWLGGAAAQLTLRGHNMMPIATVPASLAFILIGLVFASLSLGAALKRRSRVRNVMTNRFTYELGVVTETESIADDNGHEELSQTKVNDKVVIIADGVYPDIGQSRYIFDIRGTRELYSLFCEETKGVFG